MKRIISSILTVFVILTCFSVTAFAADTNLYFNDGSTTIKADADTIDLTLYLNKGDEEILTYGYDIIQLNYEISGATMEGTALKSATDFDGSNSVSSTVLLYTAKSAFYVPAQANEALATFSLTRDGDAKTATITFTNVNLKDTVTPFQYECTYPTTVTVEWPSAGPIECPDDVVATEIEIDGTTYTNVPNKAVEVAGYAGQQSGKVVAEYWVDGCTALGTKEISFTNLVNLTGSGNATFNVAITGVKEGVVITDISVNFN